MDTSSEIAIIGAGLMGHSISLCFARAGFAVSIFDPFHQSLASLHQRVANSLELLGATRSEIDETVANITLESSMEACVATADFVTEAVPEKLELKQELFAELEQHVSETCILASNTSVIPITKIMSGLENKSRAIGTHWWNPGHMIPLVEVVRTEWTDERSTQTTCELLTMAGKQAVRVEKDVPGFIGNRLQHALWREAISLVENGICSAEAVDMVVKSSFGRRLAVLGPLENADLVGTDLTLDIHQNVLFDLESSQAPSPYLEQLVSAGQLGMKSGEGFQKWSPEDADEVRAKVAQHLQKLEGILDA